mgnify:CR=1 FL=1
MASISVVNTIKTTIAAGIVGLDDIFVAIGRGAAEWGVPQTKTLTFASNIVNVSDFPIEDVVVKDNTDVTTYIEDTDYSVDYSTGIITRVGSGIGATQEVHVTYTVSTDVLTSEDELHDEIGRKRCAFVGFVTPDAGGDIVTDSDTWSLSDDPTTTVLFQAVFLVDEGEDETIREFGVFSHTVLDGSVSEGTNYVELADVDEIGYMLMKQKVAAIVKNDVGELARNFTITF